MIKILFIIVCVFSNLFAKVPYWMDDPSSNGKFIGSIGCASKQKNENLQEKIAILRAKSAISKQINISVESQIKSKKWLDDDLLKEDFTFESNQSSVTSFEIKIMDRYIDSNNTLCIWVIKK